MVLMMQTVVLQSKQKTQNLITQYQDYSFLWKETRDEEVKAIIDSNPVITEVESNVRGYKDLEEEIEAITPGKSFVCLKKRLFLNTVFGHRFKTFKFVWKI